MVDFAKKDKALDGMGAKVKRPSKSFFEKIQRSKNDFINRLKAEGKVDAFIEKEVSGKVLEAFDQYSKGNPIIETSSNLNSENLLKL